MRVLQLGPVPPPHGGVQANLTAIRNRLIERGHSCPLVAIVRSSETRKEPEVYHPESARELFKLIFNLSADIVHLHIGGNFTARLATLAFVCGLLPGKKSILTFHSGGFASSEEGKKANRLSFRGFAVRRLDKIIAVNSEIADLFGRYGVAPEKIEIIAPHVNRQPDKTVKVPEKLEDFLQKHSPVLLAVASLEPHYDLGLQIRALEFVRRDFPDAGLLIAGSGELEDDLKQQISKTGYAENVLLAGDVPHAILLHLIKRADILLRTTLFDGDAISVREALFLGTPVIATDNGMRPDGVRLIKTGDVDDLKTAISETLKTGKQEQKASGDDWENIDAVLRVYEELLEKSPAELETAALETSPIRNPKSEIRN